MVGLSSCPNRGGAQPNRRELRLTAYSPEVREEHLRPLKTPPGAKAFSGLAKRPKSRPFLLPALRSSAACLGFFGDVTSITGGIVLMGPVLIPRFS